MKTFIKMFSVLLILASCSEDHQIDRDEYSNLFTETKYTVKAGDSLTIRANEPFFIAAIYIPGADLADSTSARCFYNSEEFERLDQSPNDSIAAYQTLETAFYWLRVLHHNGDLLSIKVAKQPTNDVQQIRLRAFGIKSGLFPANNQLTFTLSE